ncbi:hypothetical protein I545_3001 [Mycobacterium kansasii 662]|uniref:Uncharacterized protein n=2 Tax=Mycobacterium kansasii TaxID=1768 RepID=A0A1V3WLV0_MYCKA|nr:hypothetical protein I547_7569 [Mycobacterium kansasii 824]EUA18716.1 hypothetical protein I545_2998 [Mycobacterium kansasii 662]KEP42086.1 hypothetical protein MKSMC1_27740 [Mycobacterium kansasii]ETZ96810.1 hypothetical protein I547_7574 [Mycobacterium kansasii 824]EUA18943.1 hypothetical protein I545_3001 [Mycobacterium kansasii 662]
MGEDSAAATPGKGFDETAPIIETYCGAALFKTRTSPDATP